MSRSACSAILNQGELPLGGESPIRRCVSADSEPSFTGYDPSLSQYMTPAWLAEAVLDRYFPDLRPGQTVADLTCGDGAFLAALPAGVHRLGFEIDPRLAARAAALPDTTIRVCDVTKVKLDEPVDAIVGNPPFRLSIFQHALAQAHRMLPESGRAGLILPAYFFQTHDTVLEMHKAWSIETTIIPRNVFPGLEKPLVFAMFTKENERALRGMAFFFEANEIARLNERYKAILASARGRVWHKAVASALHALGGEADLNAIYNEMQGRRPSRSAHWKAKIRQVLQNFFERVDRGRYRLPSADGALLTAAA